MTLKAALRTVLDVTAEAGRATRDQIIDDALFDGRYRVGLRVAWTKQAQDIGQLQARPGVI